MAIARAFRWMPTRHPICRGSPPNTPAPIRAVTVSRQWISSSARMAPRRGISRFARSPRVASTSVAGIAPKNIPLLERPAFHRVLRPEGTDAGTARANPDQDHQEPQAGLLGAATVAEYDVAAQKKIGIEKSRNRELEKKTPDALDELPEARPARASQGHRSTPGRADARGSDGPRPGTEPLTGRSSKRPVSAISFSMASGSAGTNAERFS